MYKELVARYLLLKPEMFPEALQFACYRCSDAIVGCRADLVGHCGSQKLEAGVYHWKFC